MQVSQGAFISEGWAWELNRLPNMFWINFLFVSRYRQK